MVNRNITNELEQFYEENNLNFQKANAIYALKDSIRCDPQLRLYARTEALLIYIYHLSMRIDELEKKNESI